jgi:electron transfer flavoprotein alpha subunit
MASTCPIYCFLETGGSSDIGVADLKEISYEILTEGEKLKRQVGGFLVGIIITDDTIGQSSLCQLNAFPLDSVRHYRYGGDVCLMDVHDLVMAPLVDGNNPFVALVGATCTGRSIANDIASRSDAVYLSNCLEISGKNGCLEATRPIIDGQVYSRYKVASDRSLVVSIKAGAIGYLKTDKKIARGDITEIDLSAERRGKATEKGLIRGDHRKVDLTEADMVVGIGTGVIESGCLDDVLAFADDIKAACGCTRPLVDAGIFPMSRQIGITGKTISPRTYIALGISGTEHHVKGIMDSRNIIAVNMDRDAPIFKVADVGFVGDMKRIMPHVMRSLDALRRNADA